MSSTLDNPPSVSTVTLVDLAEEFGDIPVTRIRMTPTPGTATVEDMVAANARGVGCELIDGTLVEKAVSFKSSRVASNLIGVLFVFLKEHEIGFLGGEQGFVLLPNVGRWRGPDVAYYRHCAETEDLIERDAYPELAPALAVEVLSPGNSEREIAGKVDEYFRAGTELVWVIDPDTKTAKIYRSADDAVAIDATGTLDGAAVLPGFTVTLGTLFER